MIGYKKTYCKALGLERGEYFPCEITGSPSIDFHHIVTREDRIENLMALTREEHTDKGEKKKYMVYLLETHRNYLDMNRVPYEPEWFDNWIHHYKSITGK